MKKIFLRFGPVIALLFFIIALTVLFNELRHYHLRDIRHALAEIPSKNILLCALVTGLNYLLLTSYDAMALHFAGKTLPYPKVAFTSFLSYAFANNTGSLSIITAGSVRYRLYGGWGLSSLEIVKVITFCMITFWIGYFTLTGIVFLTAPLPAASLQSILVSSAPVIGGALLLLPFSYLVMSSRKQRTLEVGHWLLTFPSLPLGLGQVAVSSLDFILFSAALYVLFPAIGSLPFTTFVGFVLIAMLLGLASNVPGGLGVFETILLLFLKPYVPQASGIAVLIAFRCLYYFLPLVVAGHLLVGHELLQRRQQVERLSSSAAKMFGEIVPDILALAIFTGGAILLFSGATPAVVTRLAALKHYIPLPLLEISHLLGSISGMLLMLLATGLRRRLDGAYFIAIILLGAGILFSVAKGFDYEEALWLLLLLLVLLPFRNKFYRRSSLFAEPLKAGWLLAVFGVFCGSVGLGLFSYKHIAYSHELWWQFAFTGDAPRFLRATIGVLVVIVFFTTLRLLQPATPEMRKPDKAYLDTAFAIANRSEYTYGYLALLGDKHLLFNAALNAYIMYGVEGKSWIAMGDPVGPDAEVGELLWDFIEKADRYGGKPAFYEVQAVNLHRYFDLGLVPLKIGEQGRVNLTEFSLDGSARKGLRHARNQLIRAGCSFQVVEPPDVTGKLAQLREISRAWLLGKNTQEKRFSLGFFQEEYLQRFPVATVSREGALIAFANLLPSGGKEELSIDLMRYLPDSPHGVMDFLFVEIMLWGKDQGYHWFDLGMAPLSGLENRPLAPVWNKIGAFIFRHGEHFYNFQGLRDYKEKFGSVWESKYLVTPNFISAPRILIDVAALVAGGKKEIFIKG